MDYLIGLTGVVVIFGLAFILSEAKRDINLRTVGIAFAIQFSIGLLVFYSSIGEQVLQSITDAVQHVIDYGKVGVEFVFGELTGNKLGFIVAFNVLPIIIFFSAFMSVLYYLGIMPLIIRTLGAFLSKCLGTSRTESISAAANVFVGMTEAPIVVKPYINKLTRSELFAVMVGGLASSAGTMLAAYSSLGIDLKYLIAASFMAAPGGLLMAKIMVPETSPDDIVEATEANFEEDDQPVNVVDAAASGAITGLHLAANVGAMLIAFIALVALVNGLIGYVGGLVGIDGLSLQTILSYIFSPLAYLLGVSWSEAQIVGALLGEKIILNEFVAFASFIGQQDMLSERSQVITTFALCGFANLGSLAILLGGLGGMAPSRRHDIARMGIKAVIAGTLANLMSAAIAGFIFLLN
ncbi:MAG: NupC/NupG family nucleoside CNT transporter [Halioglobus sp.]